MLCSTPQQNRAGQGPSHNVAPIRLLDAAWGPVERLEKACLGQRVSCPQTSMASMQPQEHGRHRDHHLQVSIHVQAAERGLHAMLEAAMLHQLPLHTHTMTTT